MVALFQSLPLNEQRQVLASHTNKRILSPLRNLIETIALLTGDLKTYTSLRCSCKLFRKWLEPVTSEKVTNALLMPHVRRLQSVLSCPTSIEVRELKVRLYDASMLTRKLSYYVDIDRRTGWITCRTPRKFANVMWSNEDLRACFDMGRLSPREWSRGSDHPIYKRLVDLNRPKKRTKKDK